MTVIAGASSPWSLVAIGSGRHSRVEIKKYADWLLAGVPGNDMVERSSLTDAVSQFIADVGHRGRQRSPER